MNINLSRRFCAANLLRVLAFLLSVAGAAGMVHAEGSRNLFPSGYTAARAPIQVVPVSKFAGVANSRQFLYVYAQKDEYILLGSRNVGAGGNISVYAPQPFGAKGDEIIPATADFSCATQTPNGAIATRDQELAGPNSADGSATVTDGYAACWYQAPATGVYGVYFSGATADSGSRNSIAALGTFKDSVTAWDVTVRSSASSLVDINGRLFTYTWAIYTGKNGSAFRINSDLYFVSADGYRYQQSMHGLDPNRAVFYANSKGFIDTNGNALYHDMRGADIYVTTGPSVAAGIVAQPPEYPLFFSDVSPGGSNASEVDKVLAALSIPLVTTAPTLSAVSFIGTLGGNQTSQSSGGTFQFTATNAQTYEIVVSRDGIDFDPATGQNRALTGTASSGTNTVLWNGLDNDGNAFPGSGSGSTYSYRITSRNGEIHFPMIDVEGNIDGGPTLIKLNGSLGATVYYDDRGYVAANGDPIGDLNGALCGATSLIVPPVPSYSLLGVDSADANFAGSGRYYRNWTGTTDSNSDCENLATEFFGTAKGLDLWTFEKSAPQQPDVIIFEPNANVDVTTAVSVPATIPAGGTVYGVFSFSNTSSVAANGVTYTLVIGTPSPGGWCPSAVTFTLAPFGNPTYNPATCEVSFDGTMPTTLNASQSLTFNFNYVAPGTAETIPVNSEINAANESSPPGVAPNTAHGETVVVLPDVAVTKISDPTSGTSVAAGSTITYTVTATVTNAALTSNLVLTDTLAGGQTFASVSSAGSYTANTLGAPTLVFTLPSGTAPGAYAVSYTATVDADASGTVGNSVVITDNGGDPDPTCTTCTTDHPLAVNITLDKTGPATATTGGTMAYVIGLGNSGGTASGTTLTVSDTLPAGVAFVSAVAGTNVASVSCTGAPNLTCTVNLTAALAAGAANGAASFTINTTAPTTAGSITNYASVDPTGGTTPPPPGASCTPATSCDDAGTNVSTPVNITLEKTGPATVTTGGNLAYVIGLGNSGGTASGTTLTVADTLPAGVSYVSATPGTNVASVSCTGAPNLTCTVNLTAALAAGAANGAASFTINTTAPTTTGTITNYASVDPSGGSTPPPPGASCTPATSCDDAGTTINAPKLEITKTASPNPFIVGQAASYTITVNNTGTADTTAISTITDAIPTGLTIGTLPAGCSAAGQNVTCTIVAGLAAGSSSSFIIPVTVTASATNGNNTAIVTGGGDPNCTGTTCADEVLVPINAPKLTITKTASPNPFIVGQTASYTITVNNTGTADTTAVSTITDAIPAGLTIGTLPAGCSAAGQNVTCTIVAGLAAGSSSSFIIPVTVTASATTGDNTAYVTGGGDPDCTTTNCPGTVTVPINTPVNITLNKAGPAQVLVNGTIVYTISLGNSGQVATGTLLTVADTLPPGVTYVSAAAGTNVTSLSCTGAPNLMCALTLTVPLAANSANGAATFTITVTAPNTAGSITNYASVDPTGGVDLPVPGTSCTPATSCGEAPTRISQVVTPYVSVPVDSRWMLLLLAGLLLVGGMRRGTRQRR